MAQELPGKVAQDLSPSEECDDITLDTRGGTQTELRPPLEQWRMSIDGPDSGTKSTGTVYVVRSNS